MAKHRQALLVDSKEVRSFKADLWEEERGRREGGKKRREGGKERREGWREEEEGGREGLENRESDLRTVTVTNSTALDGAHRHQTVWSHGSTTYTAWHADRYTPLMGTTPDSPPSCAWLSQSCQMSCWTSGSDSG